MVPSLQKALELVDKDGWAYISMVQALESIPNFCDYTVITDSSFPNVPFGFFFNKQTPEWFPNDPAMMQLIGNIFQHFEKR